MGQMNHSNSGQEQQGLGSGPEVPSLAASCPSVSHNFMAQGRNYMCGMWRLMWKLQEERCSVIFFERVSD